MPKTWLEKFHNGQDPRIERCEKPFAGVPAGADFLISSPAEIETYLRNIPAGKSVSVATMKRDLALDHGVEFTCPLTTGIFLRIVAEKAWEEKRQGKPETEIAPFWRVIDFRSPLAGKLACGKDYIVQQRQLENLPL